MSVETDFSDLVAPIEVALKAAYDRGYKAGYFVAIQSMVTAAQGLAHVDTATVARQATTPTPLPPPAPEPAPTTIDDGVPMPFSTRAPRGILDTLLDKVLAAHPGSSTGRIEAEVRALDPRIAVKSIYNRLRHWEKQGKKYRRHANGNWYLIKDLPPPWVRVATSSSQGETGGVAPPGSVNSMFD